MRTKLEVVFWLLTLLHAYARPAVLPCWSEDSYGLCQSPRHTVSLQPSSTTVTVTISSNDPQFKSSNIRLRARLDHRTIQSDERIVTADYSYSVVYSSCTNNSLEDVTCKKVQIIIWGESFPYKTITFHLYRDRSYFKALSNLTLQLLPPEDTYTNSTTGITQPPTSDTDTTDLSISKDFTNQLGDTDTVKNQGTASVLPYPAGMVAWVLVGVFLIAFLVTLIVFIVYGVAKKD